MDNLSFNYNIQVGQEVQAKAKEVYEVLRVAKNSHGFFNKNFTLAEKEAIKDTEK